MASSDPHCKAPGCTDKAKTRGLCRAHYNRVRRYGDYELRRPIMKWSRKYDACQNCGTDKTPHVGKGLCANCGRRTWQSTSKEVQRARSLKRHYGLTPEAFDALWEDQEGRCKICKRFAATRYIEKVGQLHTALHIDHDHKTKTVRGLLCVSCNRGLGFFFDDPDLLLAAAAYLRAFRESQLSATLIN